MPMPLKQRRQGVLHGARPRRPGGMAAMLGALAMGLALAGHAAAQTATQTQALATAAPAGTAAAPPIEAFFGRPVLSSAHLSPSGRWLASRVAKPGQRTQLVVSDLENKEPALVVAAFSKHDVVYARWVSDDLLVLQVDDNMDRSRGAERRAAGLMSVRRDGEGLRLLIKREYETSYAQPGIGPLEANHGYLGLGAPGTDEVIVGDFQSDNDVSKWVLRNIRLVALNARTGTRRTLVDDPPPGVTGWWRDPKGVPRFAVAYKDGQNTFFHFDGVERKWRNLGRHDVLHAPYWPSFVDAGGRVYVSWVDKAGDEQLSRLDLATGRPEPEPLVSTPGFDGPIDRITQRDTGELLGLQVLTDDYQQVWFSPAMRAMQEKVDKMLPGRINLISCAPCDRPKSVLVLSYSDQHPGEYIVHFPETNRWTLVGTRRPAIDPAQMGRKSFHRIKARDGQDLPVWVTLPARPATGPRPAVVLAHGGPWSRGSHLSWDAESQFLASRGYVVIEPEFRGSTGYGDAHYRAGWKQWGRAMQDDVTDALRFAVQQKWADPARTCIMGASYGGYATLMGLAKDPDQYRCGIATVAVSDPRLMFSVHWSDISEDSKRHTMPQLIGDPEKDAAVLAAVSPVDLAGRIKAPVMLSYGALDRRVPLEHGERMRDALARAGTPPAWKVYGDEGHGFQKDDNVIDYYGRVENFLARYLGR